MEEWMIGTAPPILPVFHPPSSILTDAAHELDAAAQTDRSARSDTGDNNRGDDDTRNSERRQLNRGAAPDQMVDLPSKPRSKQTPRALPKIEENTVPQVQFLTFGRR
jgi:hypothetical protein